MTEQVSDSREEVQDRLAGVRGNDPESLADEELLRLYRDSRAADVFSVMVRRHQAMVLRTCLRLAGNQHDAEDAAQSVFLVLAQRPEVVNRSLVGCLHGLARAAVSELRRSRRRRSEREQLAARMKSMFTRLRGRSEPMEHEELGEELDAALAHLPDQLKQAVILRYLEGHSQQEAAVRAGCTPVAMGWRSMKGLERLRTILGRRGVVLTSATLLAVLASEARATAALGLAGAATVPASAAAARVAAALVKASLAGTTVRKAVLGLLLTVGMALGVGLTGKILSRPDDTPKRTLPAPVPEPARRPAPALGLFERSLDIGGPARAGAAQLAGDVYTIRGGGKHIYREADQFRFVCRPWTGDGEIVARVASDPDQEARQVVAGVMFRDSLAPDSHHVAALLGANGECHVKYRNAASPASDCDIIPARAPGKNWVRLVRRGNKFTVYVRPDGTRTWTLVKELESALKPSLYVGLAVTAHDDAQLATTTFDQVAVRSGR
jgi:RNA polymerase sigma factor (sigma-70 family)